MYDNTRSLVKEKLIMMITLANAAKAANAARRALTRIAIPTVIAVSSLMITAPNAEAKDLSNRLGIGYKNQFGIDLPGIALQYYPGPQLAVSAVVGVDTEENNSKFGAMVKLHRVVFQEDNLNFYLGAGAGLLSNEIAGKNESGFELLAFGGVEFFFAGLENLGFSMEFGPAITSLSSNVRFRTFGDSPLRAGITFYF
jgi:hypothetical protein